MDTRLHETEDSRIVVARDSVNLESEKDGCDFSDVEGEVLDTETSTRYAKRLLLVNDICDLRIQPPEVEEQTFFGAKDTVGLIKLPPAEGFTPMLNNFMEEVKGKRTSKRSRSDNKLPLDVGKWPARNRPNLSTIESAGNPWLVTASQQNTCLT